MRYMDMLRQVTAARLQAEINPSPVDGLPLSDEDRQAQIFVRQFQECVKFCTFEDDRVAGLLARIDALESALRMRNRPRSRLAFWRKGVA